MASCGRLVTGPFRVAGGTATVDNRRAAWQAAPEYHPYCVAIATHYTRTRGMMLLKVLRITAWVLFAADGFMVGAGIVSPNMGNDAAGRGMAMGFALVGLVFLAIGGAALFFGARAHSRLAVTGSLVLLALPLLLFFGTDLESMVHSMTGWISDRKVGRYPEPAQRELAKAIQAGDPAAMQRILATRPALNARDAAGNDLLGFAVSESRALDTGVSPEKRIEAIRLLLEAGMNPNQARDVY